MVVILILASRHGNWVNSQPEICILLQWLIHFVSPTSWMLKILWLIEWIEYSILHFITLYNQCLCAYKQFWKVSRHVPLPPLKECAYTPTLTHMSACVYMHCVPFFCCAMLIQTGVIKTAVHIWIYEHFPALLGLTGRYCLQLPTKRIILPIQRTCLHAIGQLNQTTAWHNYTVYQI